jgi:SAM-dependent methyltransferase
VTTPGYLQDAAGIDRVLAACGGGRVLHLGEGASAAAADWRRRGVLADSSPWPGVDALSTGERLPWPDRAFDLVCAYGVLDGVAHARWTAGFDELLRVSRGAVLLTASGGSREDWESACLSRACRRHRLHQMIVPYEGLDWTPAPYGLLFERLPDDITTGEGRGDLAAARDLHMDMLREAGRRADAHVARYMFARQFIRPGDRVLDAACGLGYGSAVLAASTLADHVTGIDIDPWAVAYARDHYGRGSSRLTFEALDLATLDAMPAGSVEAVVSFETLEHVADPDALLASFRRLLTPAGRLVCSVPNAWLNEDGVDPNPHHLQIFDRERLERDCRRHFAIEHVYGQTAGGGMKYNEATRALWRSEQADDRAEWWLLVGMTDPAGAGDVPATATAPATARGFLTHPEDDRTHVLAFDRDYDCPALVRAMVTIGLRTESGELLDQIAGRTLDHAAPGSADEGAALCVTMYRTLAGHTPVTETTVARVHRYCDRVSEVPHVLRWQVSLRYAEGLWRLAEGRSDDAARAFEQCANTDVLAFSPLLATKTVGASLMRGWIALQQRDLDAATSWWSTGIAHAERALHQPWDEFLLSRRAPALFGLREATAIVELASRCAAGLHLLPHATDRPGVVASQLFLDWKVGEDEHATHAAESRRDRADRLTEGLRASLLFRMPELPPPADVRVAIFGTGAAGHQVIESLEARGIQVDCFVDNDAARVGQVIRHRPIVAPSSLRSVGVNVIAVASTPGRAAIFDQLTQMGYEFGRDFDCALQVAENARNLRAEGKGQKAEVRG